MEVLISNKIQTKSLEGVEGGGVANDTLTVMQMVGRDTYSSTADFKVEQCDKEVYVVDTINAPSLSVTVDTTKAMFIHVQCMKAIQTPADQPLPRRFRVTYGGVDLGSMSVFQIANCDYPQTLQIFNVDVKPGEKNVLTIVKGRYL